jgi:DNA-binding MarR family transcriptional regulator
MGEEERIDLLLHGFLSRFFAIPARQPASGPITFAQMRVLWSLDRKEPSTPGEIAGVLGVSSSTATGLVERLERGGYLQRDHSDRDRRQVWLRLRPRGRRLMAEFRRYHHSRLHRLLSRLDEGEVRRMAGALETLNDLVARWGGAR